ncbi:hypothetical protein [Methylacidimicrobium tartarophylax]|uniref:Uncharacterized protein n=1 Tax=Methylacidimicrobium tartarophylax TaxID=1041768 RepID=A0A5E6MQ30_9BACT|nr:hypothetical protein [Methylacidimicrobium tartarophylax]VVM08179.1 hypothetical protein MAMT_02167 [Methylacidimicrobium tartarophylax]
MTYCLAIPVNCGLILCLDSCTHAGTDNVSAYSKMHSFLWSGNYMLCLLSSGNPATTQGVIMRLRNDGELGADPNLLSVQSMREAPDDIGLVDAQIERNQAALEIGGSGLEATFLYRTGTLEKGQRLSLSEEDPFPRSMGKRWNEGLWQALNRLPPFPWEGQRDEGKICPLYPSR